MPRHKTTTIGHPKQLPCSLAVAAWSPPRTLMQQTLSSGLRPAAVPWSAVWADWSCQMAPSPSTRSPTTACCSTLSPRWRVWRRWLDLEPFSELFSSRCCAATRWLIAVVDSLSGDGPNLGSNDGAFCYGLHGRHTATSAPPFSWPPFSFKAIQRCLLDPGMSPCIGWGW